MREYLDYIHFFGIVGGIFLAGDAIGNLGTIGHNVIGELITALIFLAFSFTAYTIKNRV